MKTFIALLAGAAFAGSALAASANTFADNTNNGDAPDAGTTPGFGITAEFRASGIVAPNNGVRFLNAQNSGGNFDSWAAIRWDLTDLYASIDSQVALAGGTGYTITGATLRLTQSPAGFSVAGDVAGFYIADDTTAFDPQTQGGSAGAFGGPNVSNTFFTTAPEFAASWFYNNAGGGQIDNIDISTASILADLQNSGDNALTFAFQSAPGVVASYKGSSSPFNGANAPELVVSFDIVPAPGAAALMGLGGLVAARRRRA